MSSRGAYTCGIEPHFSRRRETEPFEVRIRRMLEAEVYSFGVDLCSKGSLANRERVIDASHWPGPFDIDWAYEKEPGAFPGDVWPPCHDKIHNRDEQ